MCLYVPITITYLNPDNTPSRYSNQFLPECQDTLPHVLEVTVPNCTKVILLYNTPLPSPQTLRFIIFHNSTRVVSYPGPDESNPYLTNLLQVLFNAVLRDCVLRVFCSLQAYRPCLLHATPIYLIQLYFIILVIQSYSK